MYEPARWEGLTEMGSSDEKFRIISLSALASDQPSAGHFYWQYKHLWEIHASKRRDPVGTICREGLRADHLRPTFREGANLFLFKPGPQALFRYRPRSVSRLLDGTPHLGSTWVANYDGGFAEFILFAWLSRRHTSLNFVYNFHWPLQWLQLLSSRNLVARLLAAEIRKTVTSAPANLFFSAETPQLSRAIEKFLGKAFPTYPVVSSFSGRPLKPWENRKFDVLMLPQRASEVNFSRQVASALSKLGYSSVVLADQGHKAVFYAEQGEVASAKGQPEMVWGPLNQDDYTSLIVNCRTALLPYEKDYGPWMSSGKFNDAVFFGCFPFVPSLTAMASQTSIKESAHWYRSGSVKSAANQIIKRIDAGFPKNLRAQQFSDLRDFLENHLPNSKVSEPPARRSLVPLLLFFSIYRNPSRTRSFLTSGLRALYLWTKPLRRIRLSLKKPH